jgi:hypothetical protein
MRGNSGYGGVSPLKPAWILGFSAPTGNSSGPTVCVGQCEWGRMLRHSGYAQPRAGTGFVAGVPTDPAVPTHLEQFGDRSEFEGHVHASQILEVTTYTRLGLSPGYGA